MLPSPLLCRRCINKCESETATLPIFDWHTSQCREVIKSLASRIHFVFELGRKVTTSPNSCPTPSSMRCRGNHAVISSFLNNSQMGSVLTCTILSTCPLSFSAAHRLRPVQSPALRLSLVVIKDGTQPIASR